MAVNLRPYRASDLPSVRALVESVLVEFGFSMAIGNIDRDLAEIESRYVAFTVAEDDGIVVGTVGLRVKEGKTCEIKRLYLRADRRGEGLGQVLYAHIESVAREKGFEKIWLDSSRRFKKAQRLYERNGYVLLEQRNDDWCDNVYEKSLI